MPKTRKSAAKRSSAKNAGRRRSRFVIVLCITAPAVLLLWRALSTHALFPADFLTSLLPWKETFGEYPFWNALIWDSLGQYFPWREFAAEAIRNGVIPLWNPFQFCGNPFLANGQSALFYPLNTLFWLSDIRRAFGLSATLHLMLGAWFTYLFLRTLKVGRFGGAVGAVAFSLNGYLISWLYLPFGSLGGG